MSKEPENSEDYTIQFNFQYLSDEEMLKAHQTYKKPGKSRKSNALHSKQTKDEAFGTMLDKTDSPDQRNVKRGLCSCRRSRIESPMELMVRNGREELLHHPLIMALLSFKWARMYILYYVHLIAYVLFLALFTSFMLLTEPPYLIRNETMPTSELACLALQHVRKNAYQHHILIPEYGTLIFSLMGLLNELFQLIRDRWTYFNLDNCSELTIYVSSLLTTIDTSWCMMETGLREHTFERFSSTEEDKQVHYEFLTYVLFIVFLALMCIVMMNLLVGLAVDDIKEVQRKAALKRQDLKIKLILLSETMLSRLGLFPRLPSQYYYRPNQNHSIMESLFHMAYTQYKQTATDLQVTATEEPLDLNNIDKELNTIQMQTTAIAKLLNMVVDQLNEDSQPRFFRDSAVAAAYSVDQSKEDQSSDVTKSCVEGKRLSDTASLSRWLPVNIDDDMGDEPFQFASS